MTTVDHENRHIWAMTKTGEVRCAYQLCNPGPEPADVAAVEASEAARKSMPMEIRYSH
jgi:hypothetical protein